MYILELTRQAEKAFDVLMHAQPHIGKRVAIALDHLAKDPEIGIPLRGVLKGYYKYRVGTYRIIYEIQKSKLLVIVIDIGHRKEVYR